MSREQDFRSTVTLWLRLISLAVIGFVFAEALILALGKVQGWSFYLTIPELIFEVAVRFVFAALIGFVLASICTAMLLPLLWYIPASCEPLARSVTQIAVVLVVFLDSWMALNTFIKWSYQAFTRRAVFDTILLAAFFVAFAIALCIPRTRRSIVTSLDGVLSERMTRRTAVATIAGGAALVATEFALGKTLSTKMAALTPQRPKPNIVLITFDALSAEDMTLYGSKLPTTPNIDAFARKATVFSNFFSVSSFTTPGVATMLTGLYPSESLVYQLPGRVRPEAAGRNLPSLMRAGGYATAAFMSNPYAYYLANGLKHEFDFLPKPVFQQGVVEHLWDATAPLHPDTGFGSRIDEYLDLSGVWNSLRRERNDVPLRYGAAASFQQARRVLATLPDGYFLWVHVMAPHDPYRPDSQDRGRFLPDDELQSLEDELPRHWRPHYPPDQQGLIDRSRLAYDEFIATADRAFGAFVSELEASGRLRDTAVVVSADHGESFEGGVYQHRFPYLTRPVIHIPLIIRTLGQQDGRKVAVTADQTALAPTILELAGQSKPDWMRGQALVEWLTRDGQGGSEGLAFSQYSEKNSVFKPLRHGTVGVIEGRSQYQYVLDLDTQQGKLRPLKEAHFWDLDRSSESPALAEKLRKEIYSRFPELLQNRLEPEKIAVSID